MGPALSLWRRHRLQLAFGPAQRRRAPLPSSNSGSPPIHRAHARAAAAGCPQPKPKLSLLKSQHAHQPLAAQPARPRRRGQREEKPRRGEGWPRRGEPQQIPEEAREVELRSFDFYSELHARPVTGKGRPRLSSRPPSQNPAGRKDPADARRQLRETAPRAARPAEPLELQAEEPLLPDLY